MSDTVFGFSGLVGPDGKWVDVVAPYRTIYASCVVPTPDEIAKSDREIAERRAKYGISEAMIAAGAEEFCCWADDNPHRVHELAAEMIYIAMERARRDESDNHNEGGGE